MNVEQVRGQNFELWVPSPEQLPNVWARVWERLEPALKWQIVPWSEEEILYELQKGEEFHLWIAGDFDLIFVTRVRDSTRDRTCEYVAIGGNNLRRFRAAHSVIAEWARAQGCKWFHSTGRKSWTRYVGRLGFEPHAVVFRQEL